MGERLFQRTEGFHLLLAAQHAALELEVFKAVLFPQGLGFLHNALRGQDLLPAQAEPGVGAAALVQVRDAGGRVLRFVRDIKQVAQHLHLVPLPALAQQLADGHAGKLAHQVQHGALDGPLALDDKFQLGDVQRLDALAVVPGAGFGQPVDRLQHLAVAGHRLAHHQRFDRIEAGAGIVAAVDLADAGVAGAVLQNDQVAGKAGRVRAAERHKHAVIPGNRDDLHAGNGGG